MRVSFLHSHSVLCKTLTLFTVKVNFTPYIPDLKGRGYKALTDKQTKEPLKKGDRVIALVNNLGATPLSELYAVYHRLQTCCNDFSLTIERNLVASYCTALDMQGVSITLLKVDDEALMLWDEAVNTPALRWKI